MDDAQETVECIRIIRESTGDAASVVTRGHLNRLGTHIASLASELTRASSELDVWKDQAERAISAANHMDAERHSAQELRDDATRQLVAAASSIRSLIATIDRDGGQRQEGETFAQSCERAGKAAVITFVDLNRSKAEMTAIRLALGNPSATVEEMVKAIGIIRDGAALSHQLMHNILVAYGNEDASNAEICARLRLTESLERALRKHIEYLQVLPHDNGTSDYQLSALEEADELVGLLIKAKNEAPRG